MLTGATVPGETIQFSVIPQAFSIKFAPGAYPSDLIRREAAGINAVDRHRRARRAVLKVLMDEMRLICASAVIQCSAHDPRHSPYMARAAENRNRISRGKI